MTGETDTGIFGNNPPPKVYFQVLIDFRAMHPSTIGKIRDVERFMESVTLDNFPKALDLAWETAYDLKAQYEGSQVKELESTGSDLDYLYDVVDKDEVLIVRVGVLLSDFRDETVH